MWTPLEASSSGREMTVDVDYVGVKTLRNIPAVSRSDYYQLRIVSESVPYDSCECQLEAVSVTIVRFEVVPKDLQLAPKRFTPLCSQEFFSHRYDHKHHRKIPPYFSK